jgi:hypothetical protein
MSSCFLPETLRPASASFALSSGILRAFLYEEMEG